MPYSLFEGFVKVFSKISLSKKAGYSKEFEKAVKTLGLKVSPQRIINASRNILILIVLLSLVSLTLSPLLFALLFFSGFIISHLLTQYPKFLYKMMIKSSLDQAPNIFMMLIVSLINNKSLEKAIVFATKNSKGLLSNDLKKAYWKSVTGKQSLKKSFYKIAEKWGRHNQGIKRGFYLLISGMSEEEKTMKKTLNKSLNIVLEDYSKQLRIYLLKLKTPTLLLFSFGTLLPLISISLLPLVSFFGSINSVLMIMIVLITSILGIIYISQTLIISKPPTFSRIRIPKKDFLELRILKHSIKAPAKTYALSISLIACIPFFLGLINLSLNTGIFAVWGFGMGVAVYYYGINHESKKLRDNILIIEKEALDFSYQIASVIGEGRSPERALLILNKDFKGAEISKMLSNAVKHIKNQGKSIKETFFGSNNVLDEIYSERIKSVFKVFVDSCNKGIKTCENAMLLVSRIYEKILSAEEEMKNSLSQSLSMIRITAVIFIPLVCGLIIVLYELISSSISFLEDSLTELKLFNINFIQGSFLSVELIGLFVGFYALILSMFLLRYVSLIEHGDDAVVKGSEYYKNLPVILIVYTITLFTARLLLI